MKTIIAMTALLLVLVLTSGETRLDAVIDSIAAGVHAVEQAYFERWIRIENANR